MNRRHAMRHAGRPRRHGAYRRALLCSCVAIALGAPVDVTRAAALADAMAAAPVATGGFAAADASGIDASRADASFDRNLLSGAGSNTTDLSRFEHGNPVLPGNYNLDIYLNTVWVGRRDVRFEAASMQDSATPCVDRKLLDQLGLHPAKHSVELQDQLQDPAACVSVGELIPDATMSVDMADLRLDTSVPQAYLGQMPRGYVSPEYWDAGVPAALLNYNFNSYHSSSRGLSQTSSYLGLNAGFNIGPWHLRQDSAVNWQSATAGARAQKHWQTIDSYLRRDLPSLRAQLTIGDSYTDGGVFDSFGLRGVQLATDDRMLPDSLRGYAPVVRGVANSNAKVTVSQNGVQIYQATVAPGPFTISDLYPTGYGGNLDVTVTEADGRTRTFAVPYASLAQLLRPGTTRFGFAAGELRNRSLLDRPTVVQGTVQHGFNNLVTGYAGVEGAQAYAAVVLGAALNTRYGALAFDVTEAHARIPGGADEADSSRSGRSMRVSYSKILPETNTSLSVAAYRYSTSGYLDLTDAALARDYARRGLDAFGYVPPAAVTLIDGVPLQTALTPGQQAALSGTAIDPVNTARLQRQRNRFDLTLSQRLGDQGGSFYTNVSASDYWDRGGTDTQFQLGYNNSFGRLSYGISATRTRDPSGHYDNEYFASFSLPLGDSGHAPSLSLNLSRDQLGSMQEQAMLNGSAGVDNQFNYGATVSHGDSGNAGSLNGGYRSPYAVFNASAGSGSGYSQTSLGVSGAVVAHPGGVTFGQPMGDTVGIVYVPGATGARLNSATGTRIDRFGYALVPYLTPYNLNTIEIDPKGLPLDVQLDATSAQVAPHAGAVVLLKFKTQTGRPAIVRARLASGQALPFGAQVFGTSDIPVGVVGQAGQILVRGVDQAGTLTARWQDDHGATKSCSFSYHIEPRGNEARLDKYQEVSATCTPTPTSSNT
ncbi:fimbrial biogenesis outer membrane usher protein [Frateuria edaphi]|uniref:fimbria/pilus outer membrane usher protein n=1 Tax=Frateuria edaphi TaxID=2898793 RepID=UPI001E2B473F|nr:fimbria/pilus outer membrane usher protein [Frateuria edaphi]UGB45831.1 fimbrial biogenesis outer membrane usher protein [Frateuria edaphi]